MAIGCLNLDLGKLVSGVTCRGQKWMRVRLILMMVSIGHVHCIELLPFTIGGTVLKESDDLLYPEWPHRQGGCLTCCGCTFESR